ncbi:ribonuclease HII [Patescibacteria group bacterium]|nr:ribonuclease HII [Patescibacteria group bacterium]MBU0964303.1 ribonuclease HII [Patescibacteria group bacterium]
MTRPTKREENKLFRQGYKAIAGVDEAGRGAWAGPLVAAAVILPAKWKQREINDSKKLTPAMREKLFDCIVSQAVDYCVCVISQKQIDRHGVGMANMMALKKCIYKLQHQPSYVLIDSFRLSLKKIPSHSIVRGDEKVFSIAAASIIAKVYRDRLMRNYHKKFPAYGFDRHKGYGTKAHARSIRQHGICQLHRRSFKPIMRFES